MKQIKVNLHQRYIVLSFKDKARFERTRAGYEAEGYPADIAIQYAWDEYYTAKENYYNEAE